MFSLSAIFAPILGKLLILGGIALTVILAYFGIKRKGVKEERRRQEAARHAAQAQVQAGVDEARREDATVDAQVKEDVEALTPPPVVDPPKKPGDRFQFMWLLPFLFLVGCTQPIVNPVGVYIDIPPRPLLVPCPPAPHPAGDVTDRGVLLSLADASAIRDYLRDGPVCYQQHEVMLWGHITKLENRLRAIQP